MCKTKWEDRPDEPLRVGGFARSTNAPVVYRIESLKDGWVSVVPVKRDGSRDRRWGPGWSGLITGLIAVVQCKA